MSLTNALGIAASGMRAAQAAMSTTSNNIANADVDGYTRKVATAQTVVVSGTGSGVSLSEIQRQVDAGLERRTNAARSQSAYADVLSSYLSSLSNATGTTTGDDTIASAISDLAESLQSLSVDPQSASDAEAVISDLSDAVDSINGLMTSIQELRGDADQEIEEAVNDVNAALDRLAALNEEMIRAQASGGSTADIADAQMQEIAKISAELSITYYTDGNGAVSVYGPVGVVLLNDSSVHYLEFDAAASVDTSDTLAGGTLSGVSVAGKDITSFISSGTIGGLLELRDEILPAQQDSVDLLASELMSAVNGAQNAGTALPPPNSLTSSGTISGSDVLNGTGSVRIALLDEDGNVQDFADLDLSTYATVDDLVTAINGLAGISASIGADGKLTVSADDSNLGIGLAQLSGGVGTDQQGLSSALGLNDLLTQDAAGYLSLQDAISSNTSLLARGTLSNDAALAAGDAGVVSGDASAITAMIEAVSGNRTFAASGDLGQTKTSLAEYAGLIVSHAALLSSNAEETSSIKSTALDSLVSSLANESGVNLDEETAELEILQTNYQAAANVISVIQEMYDVLLNMVG